MSVQPIVRTMEVKLPPERAFDLFAPRMGKWWPKGRTVGGGWASRLADYAAHADRH